MLKLKQFEKNNQFLTPEAFSGKVLELVKLIYHNTMQVIYYLKCIFVVR